MRDRESTEPQNMLYNDGYITFKGKRWVKIQIPLDREEN